MKNLILLVLIFSSPVTSGAIYFDPYVGMIVSGDAESSMAFDDNPSNASWTGDSAGGYYGARLGWMGDMGFMVGAEISMGFGREVELTTDSQTQFNNVLSQNYTAEGDQTDYGIFIGMSFAGMARVWGTYFLSSTWTVSANATPDAWASDGQEWEGSGFAFGASLSILGPLAIFLDYRSYEYDMVRPPGGSYTIETDLKNTEIVFGINLPLSL